MTQDSGTQRTPDTEGWSPFGGTVHRMDTDRTPATDGRTSTVRPDAPSWRPRVIDGGRGHQDTPDAAVDEDTMQGTDTPASGDILDAAAADALAVLDVPATEDIPAVVPEAVEDDPEIAAEQASATVEEPTAPAPEAPANVPEAAPQEPAAAPQEPNSTPHTPQPEPSTPDGATPGQGVTEAAETPHSTPRWRAALWSLHPGGILLVPQASIGDVINAARNTTADRAGLDRVTEIAWVYAVAVPVSVAAYTIAASVKRKWRGLGTWTVAGLWTIAVHAAPADTATVWWWTAVAYWVSCVFVLPAVIQARKLGHLMDFITGHINWIVLAIAVAVFASRGLWLPWQDKDSFVKAAVKHAPKTQCVALAAIGYGLVGLDGTAADWFTTGRAWILDSITSGASWALGGVGVLAIGVFGALIWVDYIVPGGLEPNQGKPVAHMIMWVSSLLLYPLLNLALGSVSLVTLTAVFFIGWFINVKFRAKKAPAAAASR